MFTPENHQNVSGLLSQFTVVQKLSILDGHAKLVSLQLARRRRRGVELGPDAPPERDVYVCPFFPGPMERGDLKKEGELAVDFHNPQRPTRSNEETPLLAFGFGSCRFGGEVRFEPLDVVSTLPIVTE